MIGGGEYECPWTSVDDHMIPHDVGDPDVIDEARPRKVQNKLTSAAIDRPTNLVLEGPERLKGVSSNQNEDGHAISVVGEDPHVMSNYRCGGSHAQPRRRRSQPVRGDLPRKR